MIIQDSYLASIELPQTKDDWEDGEARLEALEKILKSGMDSNAMRDFLEKTNLFGLGDMFALYYAPISPDFDRRTIRPSMIEHYLKKSNAAEAKEWVNEYNVLAEAVALEDYYMAELLLKYGADVNVYAEETNGRITMSYCSKCGKQIMDTAIRIYDYYYVIRYWGNMGIMGSFG